MSKSGAKSAAAAAGTLQKLTKQPNVHGKEIVSATLLQPRQRHARLDMMPFLVLYAAITMHMLYSAFQAEWSHYVWGRYALGAAGLLHILAFLFSHWSMGVRVLVGYFTTLDLNTATAIKVVPAKFAGGTEIVPLTKRLISHPSGSGTQLDVTFEFRKQLFVYNAETNAFEKLKYPVKETFEYYSRSSGFGSEARVLGAMERWGLNKFEVPLPPFDKLLKEQMLAPFFVFQVRLGGRQPLRRLAGGRGLLQGCATMY